MAGLETAERIGVRLPGKRVHDLCPVPMKCS
jgi:hypothetical protein